MSSKPMRKIANKELRPHARGREWTDVTDGDMRAFTLTLISALVKILVTLLGLLSIGEDGWPAMAVIRNRFAFGQTSL